MEEKTKEWVIDIEGILKNTYLIIEVLEEEERK